MLPGIIGKCIKILNTVSILTLISMILFYIPGIIGNFLALIVLHRTRSEIRSMMFYTLVAALTWNDLLGIVLTSPLPLASYANDLTMPGNYHVCRLHGFAMVSSRLYCFK